MAYPQIANDGQSEIIIKKSRFICHLKRVSTVDEAQTFIAQIKKEHKKATHNCSAYLIGEQDEIQRAHDDGEPSGTAGVPMLEVLKKKGLHNIVAVVTRYFGGIKLGAGGLIRAYGSSVTHALNEIGLILHTTQDQFLLTFAYTHIGRIDYFLERSNYVILDKDYTDSVTYTIGVLTDDTHKFQNEITELLNGTITVKEYQTVAIDIPLAKETVDLDIE